MYVIFPCYNRTVKKDDNLFPHFTVLCTGVKLIK